MELQALLLCEKVLLDERKKPSIIGVFNQLSNPLLPVVFGQFGIFVKVANVPPNDNVRFRLDFRDSDDVQIAEATGTFRAPSGTAELTMTLPGIDFAKYGQYAVQFWANDAKLGQTVLLVNNVPAGREVATP